MNRTIKFRGKRIDNGEWVYGSLWICGQGTYIAEYTDYSVSQANIKVYHETVGQFCGLLDKNGKEIYEGDIIKMDEVVCPITWSDGCFMMITDASSGRSPAIQERVKRFEIIGNVFSNPELLK